MDWTEFLKLGIAALRQSIHRNKKLIGLWEVVKDADVKTRTSDIAELERRIRIDQELLVIRETELAQESGL